MPGKSEKYTTVDFIAEAVQCSVCGGKLQIQKSKNRQITTIKSGAIQAREVRKVCCVNPSHPVEVSSELAQLVPRGQRYGYDLIVCVGLARYIHRMQRSEIQESLWHQDGVQLSTGSISELCDRFLLVLESLHIANSPALRIALQDGYPLHIDATCEYGKGGLFVCIDGRHGWVLNAARITTENEAELHPVIEKSCELFGDPVSVMRDLGKAGGLAVQPLRKRGVVDLICHFHFLGAIGKKLFDTDYGTLRSSLKKSRTCGELRTLLRDLRNNTISEVYSGKYGSGVMREDLHSLILYLLEGKKGKDAPYPFSLPHFDTCRRYLEAEILIEKWLPEPRSRVEQTVLKKVGSILSSVEKDDRLRAIMFELEKRLTAFNELRDILRLSDDELPSVYSSKTDNASNSQRMGIPCEAVALLEKIKKKTTDYHNDIRCRVAQQKKKNIALTRSTPEKIILTYLDRYGNRLFGHPVKMDTDGRIIFVAERTNNIPEHFFGREKRKIRRRVGRAHLGRDLEEQPAQAALVANLNSQEYVKIVCGSLDRLPDAFAALNVNYNSPLVRSNKDTILQQRICALLDDKK